MADVNALAQELEKAKLHYTRRAKHAYIAAHLLMGITVIASVAATICGDVFHVSGQITGAIAAIPAAAALIAVTFKPAGRSNWHYRKVQGLENLRRSLLFEFPPTEPSVQKISQKWNELDSKMTAEFEREFTLSWAKMHR